jgi:hypothetical protein
MPDIEVQVFVDEEPEKILADVECPECRTHWTVVIHENERRPVQ